MEMFIAFVVLLMTSGCGNIQGPAGPKGDTGSAGQDGQSIVGPAGLNGADGTQITIVQLCPGTSNYGTFVEVAECINGKLYGVYSANGGFLAYLANGSYTSDGIGSACNLTVNGCTVSH